MKSKSPKKRSKVTTFERALDYLRNYYKVEVREGITALYERETDSLFLYGEEEIIKIALLMTLDELKGLKQQDDLFDSETGEIFEEEETEE